MAKGRHPAQKERTQPEWDFFSFPTLAGLVAGVFFTSLLIAMDIGGFIGRVHQVLWYVSLLGVSFCLAHVFTRQFSRFRTERKREREEEEERERRALAARARAAEAGEGTEERARRRRRRRA